MNCLGHELCVLVLFHRLWLAGDIEGLLELCDENIVWTVAMDGLAVPYAASALGREDLRWRLQHLREVFDVRRFDVLGVVHGEPFCRSRVHLDYVHRATFEPLGITTTYRAWQQDGLLVRMEESVDAAYVEAYDRFVRYLEARN